MRSESFLPLIAVLIAGSAIADRNSALRAYQQRDFATAIKEWQTLADTGDAEAEYRVGMMYERGEGIPVQPKQAANWYRKAAEQAYSHAQIALGMLYAKGQGVLQDYVQAHMWLILASAEGVIEASKERDKLAEKMTPVQIAEAQRMAREWKPTPTQEQPQAIISSTCSFCNGVSAPVVLYKVDPSYSEKALEKRIAGSVVLHIIVDSEGRARDIRVVRGLGLGLDEKAIEALQQWKFHPGYRDGQPVSTPATIEMNFRIGKNR